MPRINHVKKSMKSQGSCCRCGAEIKKGDAYSWIKFRYGGKRVHCGKCVWRSSELTQSVVGELYGYQEQAEDEIAAWSADEGRDRAEEIAEELKDNVESWRDERESSLDSIPEPLQEGHQLHEYIEGAEEYISELENVDIADKPDRDDSNSDDEYEEALQTWGEEVRSAVEDVISSLSL
jgi:hypothetical protein